MVAFTLLASLKRYLTKHVRGEHGIYVCYRYKAAIFMDRWTIIVVAVTSIRGWQPITRVKLAQQRRC